MRTIVSFAAVAVLVSTPLTMAQTTFETIDGQAQQEAQAGTPFSPPSVPPAGGAFTTLDNATSEQCNAVPLIKPPNMNNNWLDDQGWFAAQRPRCGLHPLTKVDLFRGLVPFTVGVFPPCDSSLYNWGVLVDPNNIPVAYQYCKGFLLGHEITGEGFPGLAVHTADGFWRLTRPTSLTVFGGSFRMLAENVFAGVTESIPCTDQTGEVTTCTPSAYGEIIDSDHLNIVFRVDNQDIAGALNMDYLFVTDAEGEGISATAEAHFYPRKNLDPSTVTLSIIAHGTFLSQGDDFPGDERHDADTVRLVKQDGQQLIRLLRNPLPSEGLQVELLGALEVNDRIDILQVDRNPTHYHSDPGITPFEDRASFRVTLLSSNVPLDLVLYQEHTPDEDRENIVIAANIRSSAGILNQGELISIQYKVEAFRAVPAPPLTTAAVFRVQRDGTVFADGAFNAGGADLAERIDVSEPVEPGDVVELDPQNPKHYRKTRGPYSTLAAGVISAVPGFILGNHPEELEPVGQGPRLIEAGLLRQLLQSSREPLPIITYLTLTLDALFHLKMSLRISIAQLVRRPMLALMGRVWVKATTENGAIQPGDLLASASRPGYVMCCPNRQECEGAFVGKALEPLQQNTGLIQMLVIN